jgi:hypothetical protein
MSGKSISLVNRENQAKSVATGCHPLLVKFHIGRESIRRLRSDPPCAVARQVVLLAG